MLDREERVGELSRPEVKQAVLEECVVAREEGRWRGGGSGCKHRRPTREARPPVKPADSAAVWDPQTR